MELGPLLWTRCHSGSFCQVHSYGPIAVQVVSCMLCVVGIHATPCISLFSEVWTMRVCNFTASPIYLSYFTLDFGLSKILFLLFFLVSFFLFLSFHFVSLIFVLCLLYCFNHYMVNSFECCVL